MKKIYLPFLCTYFILLLASGQSGGYDPVTNSFITGSVSGTNSRKAIQPAFTSVDIQCETNKFWSLSSGGAILEWQLAGGTVTFLDTLFTASPLASLAHCNLLNSGSIATTFYGSDYNNIDYYNGSTWISIRATQKFNAGGNGRFLYYMGGTSGNTDIYRYNGITFTDILSLQGTRFAIADLAVDNGGTIWTMISNGITTDSLVAIDSSGNLVHTYILNPVLNDNNFYGCFILNNIFYVGVGIGNSTYPNTLLPITFNCSTAAVGTPIVFNDNNYLDLESCSGTINTLTNANFFSADTVICANDCINFIDLSSNATSYQWYFSGALDSTSAAQNPQNVCYSATGAYNVTLIALNAGCEDSVTFSNYIKVIESPPTPLVTQHNDTLYCTADSIYTSYQWSFDSSLIAGATDTILIVSKSGNYNVQVANKNGCKSATGINIVLGLENYANDNIISLFPNPAKDELLISTNWQPATGKKMLTIFNILGETIYVKELNSETETVNCKLFSSGIYFVQVASEGSRWTGKFIKE